MIPSLNAEGSGIPTIRFSRLLKSVSLANQKPARTANDDSGTDLKEQHSAASEGNQDSEHFRQMIAAVESRLVDLEQGRADLLENARQWVVELAMAVTGQVLLKEIQDGDYPLVEIVDKMIEQADDGEPISVYVNPKDLALINTAGNVSASDSNGQVRWAANAKLNRGAAVVEARQSSLFHDLQLQLDEIRHSLLELNS